jgi:HrpA-like RNA helicase
MDVQWGRKGNWLYFSSLDNGRRGIAPFRQFSPEYDDFSLFFQRYRKAKPPLNGNMDEDYLRKGLAFFIDYQKKQRAALSAKLKLERECLPIFKFKDEIHQLVKKNKVILIAADTGAGKSTQVPQYLMEAGFDKIAVTQPRRIACYSLAKRVANECLSYGSSSKIAYQVRFDGSKTENTRILFLTEGILLKQFELDPYLGLYNVIIVDEVHERHISCDFLLGILKKVLENRNDLRVVMMSATIQAKLFSTYFHDAPIIQVPGRMFPVSITYIPLDEKDRNLTDAKLIEARRKQEIKQSIVSKPVKIKTGPYLKILERIDEEVPKTERGDVLIFVRYS